MSAWKLVEAVAEESPAKVAVDHNAGRGSTGFNANNTGRGGGRGRGRGSSGGRGSGRGYCNEAVDYSNYLSAADRNYLSHMAAQQIELIFNLDNLCMDTFVRSYMDEAGFVPLPLLCTYQNVSCFGAPFYDIVEKMKVLQPDSRIEFDASNDTVRLKTGWENWLMPNATGGRGVPRYVKQTPEQQQAYFDQVQYAYSAAEYEQPTEGVAEESTEAAAEPNSS